MSASISQGETAIGLVSDTSAAFELLFPAATCAPLCSYNISPAEEAEAPGNSNALQRPSHLVEGTTLVSEKTSLHSGMGRALQIM